jgi:uncharacterized protein (DUF169 family)
MSDLNRIEQDLTALLALPRRPVAVAFRESAPARVPKFAGTVPAGCSFWQLAARGRTFYTVPADHYNCAIGSYTHQVSLPPERARELEETLNLMTRIGYITMDEVPGIARLPKTPGVVVYAPLGDSPLEPDIILLVGRPGKMMLLQEAAVRAGVASGLPLLARPTCMAIPAALSSGVVMSGGCIGNRVYTDLGEDELYAAIPGRAMDRVMKEIGGIAAANAQLRDYHQQRRQQLASA